MNSEEHLFFYWTRITQEEKRDFSGLSSSDFFYIFMRTLLSSLNRTIQNSPDLGWWNGLAGKGTYHKPDNLTSSLEPTWEINSLKLCSDFYMLAIAQTRKHTHTQCDNQCAFSKAQRHMKTKETGSLLSRSSSVTWDRNSFKGDKHVYSPQFMRCPLTDSAKLWVNISIPNSHSFYKYVFT